MRSGWFLISAVAFLAAVLPSDGSEFIRPDEIVPGMRGYGLTVFQGTDPETFTVEAVGVMKNSFPKQDLVIILMDDPKLVESNAVAGMSGSPIYFGGRLLGALAYGPVFSKKPIVYVTPIHNMLAELDRPPEPERPWNRVSLASSRSGGADYRKGASSVLPVESPLAVSGFSPARLRLLEDWLSPFGLIPVASGSASEDPTAGPAKFVAGAAIGVQLMTGDMSMTGIGTVTHVEPGGRVLAFGHPFFNLGQTAMPATTARVHTFMPSTYRSFKLASPIRQMGSMVQDRQPAILIDPNRTSPMVPVSVSVENAVTGRKDVYRYRVIREQTFTPILTFMGLAETLDVTEGSGPSNRAFDIRSRIRLAGRAAPVELTDVTPNAYRTLFDLMVLLENNIEEAVPNEFEFDVKVSNASKLAWIIDAKVSGRKFRPGDWVPIVVKTRSQKAEESERHVSVRLPAHLRGPAVQIEIRGGFGFGEPTPRPESIDQLIRLLERRPKGTDLIVRLLQGSPSVTSSGTVLPDLPVFFQKIMQGGVQSISSPVVQLPYERFPTDQILLGAQRIQIEIVPEGRP